MVDFSDIDFSDVARTVLSVYSPAAALGFMGYQAGMDFVRGPEIPEMDTQLNIPRFKGEQRVRRRPRRRDVLSETSGFGDTIQAGREGNLGNLLDILLNSTLKG